MKPVLEQLKCMEHHFIAVRQQNHALELDKSLVRDGQVEITIQTDLMQNLSTPKGPKEKQEWWFAGCRSEFTVITFCCYVKVPEQPVRLVRMAFLCDIVEHSGSMTAGHPRCKLCTFRSEGGRQRGGAWGYDDGR